MPSTAADVDAGTGSAVLAVIGGFLRVLALVARAHALWPAAPLEHVTAAACAAVRAGSVDPAILLAVAQHESDLDPRTVSWVSAGGKRVDISWDGRREIPDHVACGYLSAQADRSMCRAAIAVDGGMELGARELAEWLSAPMCSGSVRCGLSGYAGGVAGARAAREGIDAPAVRFADLFLARARALGYRDLKPGNAR